MGSGSTRRTVGSTYRSGNPAASKVRGDLYDLWARMVAEELPVPSHGDKRFAVAHVAQVHRLV